MLALIGNLHWWEIGLIVVVFFLIFGRGAPAVAGRLATQWWKIRRG